MGDLRGAQWLLGCCCYESEVLVLVLVLLSQSPTGLANGLPYKETLPSIVRA